MRLILIILYIMSEERLNTVVDIIKEYIGKISKIINLCVFTYTINASLAKGVKKYIEITSGLFQKFLNDISSDSSTPKWTHSYDYAINQLGMTETQARFTLYALRSCYENMIKYAKLEFSLNNIFQYHAMYSHLYANKKFLKLVCIFESNSKILPYFNRMIEDISIVLPLMEEYIVENGLH